MLLKQWTMFWGLASGYPGEDLLFLLLANVYSPISNFSL